MGFRFPWKYLPENVHCVGTSVCLWSFVQVHLTRQIPSIAFIKFFISFDRKEYYARECFPRKTLLYFRVHTYINIYLQVWTYVSATWEEDDQYRSILYFRVYIPIYTYISDIYVYIYQLPIYIYVGIYIPTYQLHGIDRRQLAASEDREKSSSTYGARERLVYTRWSVYVYIPRVLCDSCD